VTVTYDSHSVTSKRVTLAKFLACQIVPLFLCTLKQRSKPVPAVVAGRVNATSIPVAIKLYPPIVWSLGGRGIFLYRFWGDVVFNEATPYVGENAAFRT